MGSRMEAAKVFIDEAAVRVASQACRKIQQEMEDVARASISFWAGCSWSRIDRVIVGLCFPIAKKSWRRL